MAFPSQGLTGRHKVSKLAPLKSHSVTDNCDGLRPLASSSQLQSPVHRMRSGPLACWTMCGRLLEPAGSATSPRNPAAPSSPRPPRSRSRPEASSAGRPRPPQRQARGGGAEAHAAAKAGRSSIRRGGHMCRGALQAAGRQSRQRGTETSYIDRLELHVCIRSASPVSSVGRAQDS